MNELTDNGIPYTNVSKHNRLYTYLKEDYSKIVSNSLNELNTKVKIQTGEELEEFEYPLLPLQYNTMYNNYISKFPKFLDKHSDSNFSAINRVIAYQLFCYNNACWIQSLFRDLNRPIKIWKTQTSAYSLTFNVIVDLPLIREIQCNIYKYNSDKLDYELVDSEVWEWSNQDDTSYFDSSDYPNDDIFTVTDEDNIIPNYRIAVNVWTWDDNYLVKGYPENDIDQDTMYDHDKALDNIGNIVNVPRLKFEAVDSGVLSKTYPPFHEKLTEPDYWYENRIREYIEAYPNDNNPEWGSLPLTEILKRYRVKDSYLSSIKREIAHMVDFKTCRECKLTCEYNESVFSDDLRIKGVLKTENEIPVNKGVLNLYDNDILISEHNLTDADGNYIFYIRKMDYGIHDLNICFTGEVEPEFEYKNELISFNIPQDLTTGNYLFIITYNHIVDKEIVTENEEIQLLIDLNLNKKLKNNRFSIMGDIIIGKLLFTPSSNDIKLKFTNSTYQPLEYQLNPVTVNKRDRKGFGISKDKSGEIYIGDEIWFSVKTGGSDACTVSIVNANNDNKLLVEGQGAGGAFVGACTLNETGKYNVLARIGESELYNSCQTDSIEFTVYEK